MTDEASPQTHEMTVSPALAGVHPQPWRAEFHREMIRFMEESSTGYGLSPVNKRWSARTARA